jgi:hypothetical protein
MYKEINRRTISFNEPQKHLQTLSKSSPVGKNDFSSRSFVEIGEF